MAVSEAEWRRRTDQLWRGLEHAARIKAHEAELGSNLAAVVTERLGLTDGSEIQTIPNRRIVVRFNSRLPPDTVQAMK